MDFCNECEYRKLGSEEFKRREKEMKEKYGFCIHFIPDVDPYDAHTHGLCDYMHPELQIRLNLDCKTLKVILNLLGDKIKKGEKFKHKQIIKNEDICTLPFTFVNAGYDDDNKEVLRIILPDKNGLMPWDYNCDSEFKKQMKDLL